MLQLNVKADCCFDFPLIESVKGGDDMNRSLDIISAADRMSTTLIGKSGRRMLALLPTCAAMPPGDLSEWMRVTFQTTVRIPLLRFLQPIAMSGAASRQLDLLG